MTLCKKFILCIGVFIFGALLFGSDVYAGGDCCYVAPHDSVAMPDYCTTDYASSCCTSSGNVCCSLRTLSSVHNSFYIGSKTLGILCACDINAQNVFDSVFKPPRG